MAVSTSPYQNNDYQAANTFRPYQLPVNDIIRANMAIDSYWDRGAERVKGVYDTALGLKLSLEPNREIRDQYMKDAEKQMTKLSSLDLSDPSVQRQGLNLFKPLLQDRGVVSDDAATRHIERVNNEALSYRTKDGGKYYSSVNHKYALDGSDEFFNSPDRMGGERYLKKRKEYEPFYDYTAEYDKILKNCPSSSNTSDSVLGSAGYIERTSEKVRSEAKVRTCMEAGLSPKAYRQMQIEGYMNYKGRPDVLRDDYVDFLSTGAANISAEIQKLSGTRDGIASNKKLRTDEKQPMIDALDQQISALGDQVTNHTASIKKLRAGDMSDIIGNEEQISGSLYQYRKVLKESYAASLREFEHTYKADPVSMQRFGFAHAVNMENLKTKNDAFLKYIDFGYDVKLKDMDHAFQLQLEQMKLLNSGGGSGSALVSDGKGGMMLNPNLALDPVTSNFTETPADDNKGYENINSQLGAINTTIGNNEEFLYNSIKEKGEADPAFRERLSKAFGLSWEELKARGNNFTTTEGKHQPLSKTFWFQNYVKENPNDPAINTWNKTNSAAQISAKALNSQILDRDAEVAQRLGIKTLPGETSVDALHRATADKISNINDKVVVDGVTITAKDIQEAIEGRSPKLKVDMGDYWNQGLLTDDKGTYTSSNFYINGKLISKNKSLLNLLDKVKDASSGVTDKINSMRKEVYKDVNLQSEPWFRRVDNKSAPVQQIEGLLSSGDDTKKRGVQIEQLDLAGGYKMRVPGLGDNEFKKIVKEAGLGMQVDRDGDVITVKGSTYNLLPSSIISPEMKQTAYILSTIPNRKAFQALGHGEKLKDGDLDFPMFDATGTKGKLTVEIHKGADGMPLFRIVDEKKAVRLEERDAFSIVKALQTITR